MAQHRFKVVPGTCRGRPVGHGVAFRKPFLQTARVAVRHAILVTDFVAAAAAARWQSSALSEEAER